MRRLAVLSSTTRAVSRSPGASLASSGGTAVSSVLMSRTRRLAALDERQREPEPASLAEDALDLQVAAHLRDQMIADGETQARAAGRRAGLRLREGGEDLRQRLRFDADAGVADLEAQMRPRRRG